MNSSDILINAIKYSIHLTLSMLIPGSPHPSNPSQFPSPSLPSIQSRFKKEGTSRRLWRAFFLAGRGSSLTVLTCPFLSVSSPEAGQGCANPDESVPYPTTSFNFNHFLVCLSLNTTTPGLGLRHASAGEIHSVRNDGRDLDPLGRRGGGR